MKETKPWTQLPLQEKGMLRQSYKQAGLDEKGKLVPLGDDNPQTLPLTHSETDAAERRIRFDGQIRKTGTRTTVGNYAAGRNRDKKNGK